MTERKLFPHLVRQNKSTCDGQRNVCMMYLNSKELLITVYTCTNQLSWDPLHLVPHMFHHRFRKIFIIMMLLVNVDSARAIAVAFLWWTLGSRRNIKSPFYQYRDSHNNDKMAWPCDLYKGNPIPGKPVFILRQGSVPPSCMPYLDRRLTILYKFTTMAGKGLTQMGSL